MKTLKLFTLTVLTFLSVSALANGKTDRTMAASKKTVLAINQPEMQWGDPADINQESLDKLKSIHYLLIEEPLMNWGEAEEMDLQAVEKLKNVPLIPLPEMIWGNPSDAPDFKL